MDLERWVEFEGDFCYVFFVLGRSSLEKMGASPLAATSFQRSWTKKKEEEGVNLHTRKRVWDMRSGRERWRLRNYLWSRVYHLLIPFPIVIHLETSGRLCATCPICHDTPATHSTLVHPHTPTVLPRSKSFVLFKPLGMSIVWPIGESTFDSHLGLSSWAKFQTPNFPIDVCFQHPKWGLVFFSKSHLVVFLGFFSLFILVFLLVYLLYIISFYDYN